MRFQITGLRILFFISFLFLFLFLLFSHVLRDNNIWSWKFGVGKMFNVLLSNDGLLGQTSIILWRPQHVLCYFWISFFQNLLLVDCSFGSSGDRQDSVGSILYRSFVSHFGIFIFQKSVSVPFLYINSEKFLNKSCWIL